jgi:peptide deformylase
MIILRKDKLELVNPNHELMNRVPKLFDFEKDKDSACFIGSVLFQKMGDLGGIGLSANQLGLDMQVFVMANNDDKGIYIFNPQIIETSKQEVTFKEGCLSYPGIFLYIKRPLEIKAKYYNEFGEENVVVYRGLTARVFQHEYDHMMGTDFTRKVSKFKLNLAKKKYVNVKKKIIQKHANKTILESLNANSKFTGV